MTQKRWRGYREGTHEDIGGQEGPQTAGEEPTQWGRVWLSRGGAPGIEWVEPRMLLLQHPQSLELVPSEDVQQ